MSERDFLRRPLRDRAGAAPGHRHERQADERDGRQSSQSQTGRFRTRAAGHAANPLGQRFSRFEDADEPQAQLDGPQRLGRHVQQRVAIGLLLGAKGDQHGVVNRLLAQRLSMALAIQTAGL